MKTLVLIRHAHARPGTAGMLDHERPLSKRGEHEALRTAAYLKSLGSPPGMIISSHARRANDTAQILARELALPGPCHIQAPELYAADAHALRQLIAALPETEHTIALVGHNPAFSELASMLDGQDFINMPTAAAIAFQIPAHTWLAAAETNAARYRA